jgi:hypothetical protein
VQSGGRHLLTLKTIVLAGAALMLALYLASQVPVSQAKDVTFYRVTHFTAAQRVVFRGASSANCQSNGRCGLSGSIVFSEYAGPGLLAWLTGFGHEIGFGDIPEPRATVQAAINFPGGGQPCSDRALLKNATAGLDFLMLHNRVRVSLPTADELGVGSLLANRCGGPLDADLGDLRGLQRTYGLSKFHRPIVSIEFAKTQLFQGGGFVGSVTTEVHARLRRIHCLPRACRGSRPA